MPTSRTPRSSGYRGQQAGPSQNSATSQQRSTRGNAPYPNQSAYGTVQPIPMGTHSSIKKKTPKGCFIALLIGIVLAVALGIALYLWYNTTFSTESTTEQIQANATADVAYDLPAATDMAGATYDSLVSMLDSMGVTYYDNTDDDSKTAGNGSFIKLPDGVDIATAAAWYAQGVENLSTANAVKFLNGSWTISLAQDTCYDCRLRFAMFGAGGDASAVTSVKTAVGLTDATVTSEGTDSNGNTYVEGTFEKNGTTYTYRIAACPLSDVYNVDDLPSDSSYVAVTITK